MPLSREVHGVVFSDRVDDLADTAAVDFCAANGHDVTQRGGFITRDDALASARLRASDAFEDGREVHAHLNVRFNRLLHWEALEGEHGHRVGRGTHRETTDS